MEIYKFGASVDLPINADYHIYQVTKEWNEQSVSWTQSEAGTSWQKEGGDHEIAELDIHHYEGTANGWQDFIVTAGIQDFVKNPESNYGFIIRLPGEGKEHTADECFFGSSEYHNDSQKPKLTVTYDMNSGAGTGEMANKSRYTACKRTNDGHSIYIPFVGMSMVRVYDMHGRRVTENKTAGNLWFEIPNVLPQGMYMVSIENGTQTRSLRMWLSK